MASPLNCTSSNFEKVSLSRFRLLANCLPQDSKIFREPWGRSTVICIDFIDCPHSFPLTPEQIGVITEVIKELGLSYSVIFRAGKKILGWKKIDRD
ncbi:MAG: hypothetical protein QNJ41_14950 [Xenococcaceae cyanobacterium MO_188.B32]|nr:hypothetical protein [Xenococcaceae cyanobacterium MO_188.B32]